MENSFLNTTFSFIGFFFAGLAMNLMPCIYPMLTVTVSLFRQKEIAEENIVRSFTKAFFYVLGMVFMYSFLGLFVAFTGTLFGGILQNRWVLLGVAVLMSVLALSMFGVYQIRLPSGLSKRLGGQRKATYWGLFFSGLCVGIFAAPCIGPPVIALLTSVAQKRDPYLGFLGFFIFSLGLGTPYLVLGTFSGLLKKMPKSGTWLNWVEHLFGVILLGLALFYFSIVFIPGLLHWVIPISLILGGFYLGFFDKSGHDRLFFVRLKWLFGIISFIIAGSMIYYSHYISNRGLTWEEYKPYKLALAEEQQQPVVIDFYADWCITCHELENFVFNQPTVMAELSHFVRLRVDATDLESSEAQQAAEQFDIPGLPVVIFIDKNGREVREARVTSYVPPPEFLKSIELTLKSSQ